MSIFFYLVGSGLCGDWFNLVYYSFMSNLYRLHIVRARRGTKQYESSEHKIPHNSQFVSISCSIALFKIKIKHNFFFTTSSFIIKIIIIKNNIIRTFLNAPLCSHLIFENTGLRKYLHN